MMKDTFLVALPFFLLIVLGFGACRIGWVAESSISGMNSFVLYFALPCMLYRFACQISLENLFNPTIFLLYTLTSLILLFTAVALSKRIDPGMNWRDVSMAALLAVFPNTGFLGLPFLARLFGPQAATPVMISIFIDMVLTSSLCIFMAHLKKAGREEAVQQLKTQFMHVLKNPLPWAIALGLAQSYFELEWIPGVQRSVDLLSDAASPVALFALGGLLASQATSDVSSTNGQHGQGLSPKQWRVNACVVFIKLVLQPALLFLGGLAWSHGLGQESLGQAHFALMVLVMAGALPSASNIILLADKTRADAKRLSKVVLITTLLSLLTLPLWSEGLRAA